MGRTGTAVTSLRPAGTARFDDLLLDVVSEGMFIGAGTTVTVIRVEGPRVVVSPAQPGLGQ
jgi:membrane-bound serine protease (ClpP class)